VPAAMMLASIIMPRRNLFCGSIFYSVVKPIVAHFPP
jgi:hypothetical protein